MNLLQAGAHFADLLAKANENFCNNKTIPLKLESFIASPQYYRNSSFRKSRRKRPKI